LIVIILGYHQCRPSRSPWLCLLPYHPR
jgi:hypothetical protein